MAVYGIKEFENQGRDLLLIKEIGPDVIIYLDKKSGEYFAKGPFGGGHVESDGYMALGVMEDGEIAKWIREFTENNIR